MGKTIDKIVVRVIIFLAVLVIATAATDKIWLALAISLAVTVALSAVLSHFAKKRRKHYLNLLNFDTYAILNAFEFFKGVIPKLFDGTEVKDGYFLVDGAVIMPNYKNGVTSRDDVAKAYRLAVKEHADKIYVLHNGVDRQAVALANSLKGYKYYFISDKQLYRSLKARDLLPVTEDKFAGERPSIRDVMAVVFSKRNVKNYLFTSAILIFLSFLTPLKYYYVTLGALSLVMAVASFFGVKGTEDTTKGIFADIKKDKGGKDD